MTDFPEITYENLETLAASAFALSRLCATALRADVIHHLKPDQRRGAERLLQEISARRIFDEGLLDEINLLIDRMSRLIVDGTTKVEIYQADECHNDGGGNWHETRRNEQAEDLSRALSVLLGLQEALYGVQDLMQAERALADLRRHI
ncbi:hypothetical protein SAMN04487859_12915 [Roseovarius lutimaris]|uniref:Uncharacterized protein n=1 Tax=Roseovarius lutimaris TaxID=1005928 RepID=A0A1I5GEH1_9RHOB|nr:hypothetical protein [Roseovarius lutimaris]SFO34350.1 hypothetical protein SAMN04487859_12915 [Roseovarius lutimaris]